MPKFAYSSVAEQARSLLTQARQFISQQQALPDFIADENLFL